MPNIALEILQKHLDEINSHLAGVQELIQERDRLVESIRRIKASTEPELKQAPIFEDGEPTPQIRHSDTDAPRVTRAKQGKRKRRNTGATLEIVNAAIALCRELNRAVRPREVREWMILNGTKLDKEQYATNRISGSLTINSKSKDPKIRVVDTGLFEEKK